VCIDPQTRCRTLCGTARLKSPCGGGKGSRRSLPRAKILEIMLNGTFKSYLTVFKIK
jgi:hypothetical protein